MEMVRCADCNIALDEQEVEQGFEVCEQCEADYNGTDEKAMQDAMYLLLENIQYNSVDPAWDLKDKVRGVRSFDEASLMTYDKGIVVKLESGSEFQITITQSK